MNVKYLSPSYLFEFLVISIGEISRIHEPKGMNIFKAVDSYCQITLFK